MKALGIYTGVNFEVGKIIVADVDPERVAEYLKPDRAALQALISKSYSRRKRRA
jgi:isocitrate lyase